MARAPGATEWEYKIPEEGDDVKIPCEVTMMFNTAEFRFNNLYIDGVLRIDPGQENSKIIATNIWIRGGKLAAGYEEETKRFDKSFIIELVGDTSSENLMIDDISRTGTKSIAVTGRLELFGIIPKTTRTRLVQTVNPGDT